MFADIFFLFSAYLIGGARAVRRRQSLRVGDLLAEMITGGPRSLEAIGSDVHIERIAESGMPVLFS